MIRRATRLAARYLLPTVLAFACVHVHAQDPNVDIYGKWKIKGLIGGGAISSRSQSQVEKIIGKVVTISHDQFNFNGQTCVPNYQRSREETVQHFDTGWRADVSDIPFPNPVTIIDTGCTTFLYPIRKGHLMIADDGDFFEAVRVKSSTSAKPINTGHP